MRALLPALALLAACGRDPFGGGRCEIGWRQVSCEHETSTLEFGDRGRDLHWQVPTGEAPEAGWPAVILFQGALFPASLSWWARKAEPMGGWNQALLTADLLDAGYAVFTPEAPGEGLTCWNTNVPGYAGDWEGSPDDEMMLALLEALEAGDFGPIDLDRLYATGISSGGYMTSRMALAYPGVFRALAIHSASYATCVGVFCSVPDELPDDHPPTLFLHGGLDATVPVWTMSAYRTALEENGTEVDDVVKWLAGHAWLDEAPDAILSWFDEHAG